MLYINSFYIFILVIYFYHYSLVDYIYSIFYIKKVIKVREAQRYE